MPVVGTPQARPGAPDSVVTDWSVDPDDWGAFLCKVWDDWYRARLRQGARGSVRDRGRAIAGHAVAALHHGGVLRQRHGRSSTTATSLRATTTSIPSTGSATSRETHWGDMAYSEPQKQFGFAKRDALPQYCRQCPHLKLCWGECPKNRLVRTPEGEAGLNYLCPGLKRFYTHIQRDMPEILRRVQKERAKRRVTRKRRAVNIAEASRENGTEQTSNTTHRRETMRTAKELPTRSIFGEISKHETVTDNTGHRGRSRACGQHAIVRAGSGAKQETQHRHHLGRRHRHSGTSAPTIRAGWATRRRTLTASPRKVRSSPTGTGSRAAPPDARASSPARAASAPGCSRSGCRARPKV